MFGISVEQAEEFGRTPLVLYARVRAKIEKTGAGDFTPAEVGMTPRTVRACVAELKQCGMADFIKPRRVDAPYRMILPAPSVRTLAGEWMAGEVGSNAAQVYPTLSADVYVHFRKQYRDLGREEFEERLKRGIQSAVLAEVKPANLMDWLDRGMQRPKPEAGDAGDPNFSRWQNEFEREAHRDLPQTLE